MNRLLHLFGFLLFLALIPLNPAHAQDDNQTFTTPGGMTLSYPARFYIASDRHGLIADMVDRDEGAFLSVMAGTAIRDFLFNEDTGSQTPEEWLESLDARQTRLDTPTLKGSTTLDNGELSYWLYRTNRSAQGYASLQMADDRQVVLRYFQRNSATGAITPEDFESMMLTIMSSIIFDDIEEPAGAISIYDMPPGVVQFPNGMSFDYPTNWGLDEAVPLIRVVANLQRFGIVNNRAMPDTWMSVIVFDDEVSIENFINDPEYTSSRIRVYLGEENLNLPVDQLWLQRELANGRMVYSLDRSLIKEGTRVFGGNLFLVTLDNGAWAMFEVAASDDEDIWSQVEAEVWAMLESITLS